MSAARRGQDEFGRKLLETFRVEAQEHVRALASGLIELENRPESSAGTLEVLFREVHSLKGASQVVGLTDIAGVCQSFETVAAALKQGRLPLSPELLDLLHRSLEWLNSRIPVARSGATDDRSWERLAGDLQQAVRDAGEGAVGAGAGEPAGVALTPSRETAPAEDTIRVSAERLAGVLAQVEELISARLAAARRRRDLREAGNRLRAFRSEWGKMLLDRKALQRTREPAQLTARGSLDADPLERALNFLDRGYTELQSHEATLQGLGQAFDQDYRSLSALVEDLLDGTKALSMLPFSGLLEVLPPLVRNLARQEGKEVDLQLSGGEIRIDRRILEAMKDPMLHLVRNSIDHGLEPPEERVLQGKPARGTLRVRVRQPEQGLVELSIADDGRGIDPDRVRRAAADMGHLPAEEASGLEDKAAVALVFQSGLTTADRVSELSGRGLGLAIVQEKTMALGGFVSMESQKGSGTIFRLGLPLTLASLRAVVVRAGAEFFCIPTSYVERVRGVRRDEIRTVENRPTLKQDGQALAYTRLSSILGISAPNPAPAESDRITVTILAHGGQRMAVQVEEVIQELEVLVRRLGETLSRLPNVTGATLLENGKLALVLHVPDLLESAVRQAGGGQPTQAAGGPRAEPKSILVVEDSITSRTLVKGILEGAGFIVETAVDGLDGYTRVRSKKFDLVISDVDMPRMSGLDLTARIRGHRALAELPVILLSGLQSTEERARGMDVGASAYLVKSSFDQGNLLEVVRSLI